MTAQEIPEIACRAIIVVYPNQKLDTYDSTSMEKILSTTKDFNFIISEILKIKYYVSEKLKKIKQVEHSVPNIYSAIDCVSRWSSRRMYEEILRIYGSHHTVKIIISPLLIDDAYVKSQEKNILENEIVDNIAINLARKCPNYNLQPAIFAKKQLHAYQSCIDITISPKSPEDALNAPECPRCLLTTQTLSVDAKFKINIISVSHSIAKIIENSITPNIKIDGSFRTPFMPVPDVNSHLNCSHLIVFSAVLFQKFKYHPFTVMFNEFSVPHVCI